MNDTSMTARSARRVEWLERAGVGALADLDARVVAQPLRELPVASVDGHDFTRATLKQAVGEAPGRRPDIEAAQPVHLDARAVERVRQLLATPADEGRRLTHLDGRAVGDRLGGTRGDRPVDAHIARHHERTRALRRGREPAFDEQYVEAWASARASGAGDGHLQPRITRNRA